MCLQIYSSYLTLRQRRGTRSICIWERRMSTGLERAAGGAVLAAVKALLMLLGFSWCYSTCKAALFFPPFFFSFRSLLKNSSENQFCELFQQITPNSLHPTFQELWGGQQHCSRWQIQLPGFCIFIYNTRTNPLWTYYLKLERGLF